MKERKESDAGGMGWVLTRHMWYVHSNETWAYGMDTNRSEGMGLDVRGLAQRRKRVGEEGSNEE